MSEMLPGFFNVGDKLEDSGNESLKRLKKNPEEFHESPKIVLKYRNSLKYLNNRELGVTAGIQAEKEFYQMKISHKEKISSSNLLLPFSPEPCEVHFINGDDKSLFGVWCRPNYRWNLYCKGELSYVNNEGSASKNFKHCGDVVDMCRCSIGFMTVRNYDPKSLPILYDIFNVSLIVSYHYWPPPWYCCCYLHGSDLAVLGGNGYIVFISGSEGHPFEILQCPGKVCTVSHLEPSGIVLAGLDTGVLTINDRRTSVTHSIKISDKAVNDSAFINDKEVIITDVEGKLVKVDLRMEKTSDMFFGHKHSVTKRPFSVANDMLCATGADNVVRIWHISGGYPIHVQKPTSRHEVRGWLNSDGNKTYLNYFEGESRTVFTVI